MDQWTFPINPLSPRRPIAKRNGLFGTKIKYDFPFEKDYHPSTIEYINSDDWYFDRYSYENDHQYYWAAGEVINKNARTSLNNRDFLIEVSKHGLKLLPMVFSAAVNTRILLPVPRAKENQPYNYPESYFVWKNDDSWCLFSGSPDVMELPEDVIKQTNGHYKSDRDLFSPSPNRMHRNGPPIF